MYISVLSSVVVYPMIATISMTIVCILFLICDAETQFYDFIIPKKYSVSDTRKHYEHTL